MQWGNKRIRYSWQLYFWHYILLLFPHIKSILDIITEMNQFWTIGKQYYLLKWLTRWKCFHLLKYCIEKRKSIQFIYCITKIEFKPTSHMFVFSYLLFRQYIIWEQIQLWNKTIENLAVTTERKDVECMKRNIKSSIELKMEYIQ